MVNTMALCQEINSRFQYWLHFEFFTKNLVVQYLLLKKPQNLVKKDAMLLELVASIQIVNYIDYQSI